MAADRLYESQRLILLKVISYEIRDPSWEKFLVASWFLFIKQACARKARGFSRAFM
jgi:hypothetical protein